MRISPLLVSRPLYHRGLGNPQWKTPSFEELMVLEWIDPVKHFARLQGIMAYRMRQYGVFFARIESKAWMKYAE